VLGSRPSKNDINKELVFSPEALPKQCLNGSLLALSRSADLISRGASHDLSKCFLSPCEKTCKTGLEDPHQLPVMNGNLQFGVS
jgi:hypothetical protein